MILSGFMKDLGYLSHIVTGLILFGVYSMCVVVICVQYVCGGH